MAIATSSITGEKTTSAAAGDEQIEAAFDEAAPSLQRRFGQVDRRQAVEVFDARAQHHELQQIGHDVDGDDAAHEPVEQRHHRLRRRVRQRDEDVIDLLFVDDALGLVDRAEAFQPVELRLVAVAEIADDAEAELAMRVHPLDDRAGQLAASGDEHAIEVFPGAMAPLRRSRERAARPRMTKTIAQTRKIASVARE